MVSRIVFTIGVAMFLAGAGVGYAVSLLAGPDGEATPEYQAQRAEIQRFQTYLTCIPPSHTEIEVAKDTWIHYNYDDEGDLMMIEIETARRQDSPAWGYLPEGHPGMEFEHWALHVWFRDPNEACLDLESLIEKLRGEGLTVEPAGEVEPLFFPVKGRLIEVDGGTLQVFVYDDLHTANNEAARVSPDGYTVGNTSVEWTAPPHFYQNGKMIVIYLGDEESLKETFEKVIGYQFAGS